MINRIITHSNNNSFFIFGARGTGKTTWLKKEFIKAPDRKCIYIDLLDFESEELYFKHPQHLKFIIDKADKNTWVIIDEIQKNPKLLNTIHQCIQENQTRFVLTGSSARKLKRGAADMLAGRAFLNYLFPFTHIELGNNFSLQQTLSWGTLPQICETKIEDDRKRFLNSYTRSYLKEEIVSEQIIRKLEPFRTFLEVAAQQNTEIVNFSGIARDVGVDTVTVQSYFQILEDTLIGYLLPAYHESIRKRQRQNPKFYYFDLGVTRQLSGTMTQTLVENTYAYGKLFEQFVILEAIRLNSYFEKDFRFSYIRTKDGAEIDLVIERPGMPVALIEIKSAKTVDERDIKHVARFKKDMANTEAFVFSQDPRPKKIEGVNLLPWKQGLSEIGLTS